MPETPQPPQSRPKPNPRWLAAIDGLLIAGIKLGPAKKHEAIEKILALAPSWTRGNCWSRIRYLRKTALADNGTPDNLLKRARTLSKPRAPSRPWSAEDDDRLLNWAGYERVDKIAQRLGRSVSAVRFRLGALGMSAKLTDGHSQRELTKMLHVSIAKLREFIGREMLRVRDPRITAASLAAFCNQSPGVQDLSLLERLTSAAAKDGAYSWERTADLLNIPLEQVHDLICRGKLKLVDTFVTDRSFEEFCRKHGTELNPKLIDPANTKWLITEYGLATSENQHPTLRPQKHALIIRTCRCGRKIAGNVFFRHVRHCAVATASGSASAAGQTHAMTSRTELTVP